MNLKLALILFIVSTSLFAESEAILKLDTFGHSSLVNDILVTKSGDIVSASQDKTIRVWSSSGVEKRKILGQIGNGNDGQIFAIALSSNEKYLAVGGYMKNDEVRIYDFASGTLLHILKSHTDVVIDLAFSADDRYLVTGSADKSSKIWSVNNNFSLKDTVNFHTTHVYAVRIIKKGGNYFAVSAGDDRRIALYDMQQKTVVEHHTKGYNLDYLAINTKLEHIAVSGEGYEIIIYDFDLQEVKTIESKTKPQELAYDRNGDFLIAGSLSKVNYEMVNIYNVSNNYSLTNTFKEHNNLTQAVAFLNANDGSNKLYAVSAGGDNNEIYVWDADTKKIKTKIEGVGSSVASVGIKNNAIAWGNVDDCNEKNCSNFEKSINLKDFKISDDTSSFNRISTKNSRYELIHATGGDYGYADGTLNIDNNGVTEASITRDSTNGFRHRSYGWYKDLIVSGGSGGKLKVYNKDGEEIASLLGHTGEIWSMGLYKDTLVSGGGDQTMMLWDLSVLNSHSKDVILHPMLSVFTTRNDEWVAWTKGGYFNASVGGDKYVGYHINQGADKEARFVGSDKYFDTFYRPDIISLTLKLGSEKKAIAYAGRTRKVETVEVSQSLPPVITLTSQSNIRTSSQTANITFDIKSEERIKEIIVTQNGKRIVQRALKRKTNSDTSSETYTIDLDDGQNYIEIKARNAFAMSDSVTVDVFKTTRKKNIFKPTLYMLSVGVSKYKNPEYNLGVADKDAIAMAKMFKKQEGKIYKDVVLKTLTNDEATSDNILDALDWIDREVTSKDVAMIFVAGHGVNDEKGNYYFLSHDANLNRLRRSAVKWLEIQDTIKNLPSKVILLADTCHSGNITGTRRDITSAIKSITNSGSGSIIMTATTGSGYSYEQKSWGHGAFTKALLDGIDKYKADYDEDGAVSIKEIDLYVTNRVKSLTGGKQKPTTIIPDSIPDFAIGVR